MTVLLLVLPLLGCLAVLGLPPKRAAAFGVAVTSATLATALLMAATFDYHRSGFAQFSVNAPWIPLIDLRIHLGVDGISLPLVVLTALLCALCAGYLARPSGQPERPRALVALLLLTEVGMLGTFVALNLLLFFVFFEVVLVPMYAVIAGWGGQRRAAAARQFILYTLLGSGVLLVGLLLLYSRTSTMDMVVLVGRAGTGLSHGVQVLGFLLIAGGLAVKVPVWPLHSWLPDAHTQAPTVGSVLLAGVLLKMGTYGMVRIAVPMLPEGAVALAPALGALGVAGIVYAALACLAQRDLKRLIAFSSVGHMGFVLLGIATLTPVGINAALLGNIAHGLITGLLFFLVGGIAQRYGSTDIDRIGGGLLAKAPRLGSLLVFAAVASLGLPGLAGFWGEMLAMLSAFRPAGGLNPALYLVFLAVAGLGTVLTAAYFLVMLRRVAQGVVPPRWTAERFGDVTAREWVAWTPLLVLVLAIGLWPRIVLGVTDGAVRVLLRGG
ncbi:NADH-quinone oxidoreductase subunit M [Solihabitans fulvus]|uniref:NADH-quinone oxidoreductase subunit M n=1 Tax=Solihabitans fulvus TaxID=1892852 RepID=A0A5B2XJI9_9PSEU|nr:NADH-quinone oxidoreductase subunit M [Solihabitans fulvus]KAA2263406.1 NADH-quinone oxidoreductase subunit M [Solihabitans fulvus]